MSGQEIREMKMELLMQLHEAEQHLSELEVRAKEIDQYLGVLQSYARKMAFRAQPIEEEFFYCGTRYDVREPKYPGLMNYQRLMALAGEIREARNRVAELEASKKKLGLL